MSMTTNVHPETKAFEKSLRQTIKGTPKLRPSVVQQIPQSEPIFIIKPWSHLRYQKTETFNIFRKSKPKYEISFQGNLNIFPRIIENKPLGKDLIIRFRPPLKNDPKIRKSLSKEFQISSNSITLNNKETIKFNFEKVIQENQTQEDLYKLFISYSINEILNGYNVGYISCGSKNSGKTFSLLGDNVMDKKSRGIIPRVLESIFNFIQSPVNIDANFELKFSCGKIYDDGIKDLLNRANNIRLNISEDIRGDVYTENLTEAYIESEEEILYYLKCLQDLINRKEAEAFSIFFKFELTQKFPLIEVKSVFQFFEVGIDEKDASFSNLINYLSTNSTNNSKNFFENIPYKSTTLTHLMKNLMVGLYKTIFIMNVIPGSSTSTINSLKISERIQKLNKFEISKTHQENLQKYFLSTENNLTNDEKIHGKRNIVNTDFTNNFNKSTIDDSKIAKLSEEIEKLKTENSELIEKCGLINLAENIGFTFTKSVDQMEKLSANFKKSFTNAFHAENLKLKDIISRFEKEALEETKGITFESGNDFANFNCFSRIRILAMNLGNLVDSMANEQSSYMSKSYVNLYKNAIFIVNEILSNFTQKKDIFETRNLIPDKQKDHILIERSKYNFLKNSYTQLSFLLIHYEKLLMDILNRLHVDLKNYQLYESSVNKYEDHIADLSNNVKELYLVFEKFRDFKLKELKKTSISEDNQFKNLINNFKNVQKRRILSVDSDAEKIKELEQIVFHLKEELRVKDSYINNLLNEVEEVKKMKESLEKSVVEYQENNKITFEQELINQVEAFNILKSFYLEEINLAKNFVNGFAEIIDEFLINKDFYSLTKNKKKFINCYVNKAKKFIDTSDKLEKGRTSIIYKIHEKFILEEGNATKKIEFFLKEEEKLYAQYGLNGDLKTKCPLRRILKNTLGGDKDIEIWGE